MEGAGSAEGFQWSTLAILADVRPSTQLRLRGYGMDGSVHAGRRSASPTHPRGGSAATSTSL